MKTKLLLGCSFGSSLLMGGCIDVNKASNTATQQKPNVIFIVADDLGYGDISCYGEKNNLHSPCGQPCRKRYSLYGCSFGGSYQYPVTIFALHRSLQLATKRHRYRCG